MFVRAGGRVIAGDNEGFSFILERAALGVRMSEYNTPLPLRLSSPLIRDGPDR